MRIKVKVTEDHIRRGKRDSTNFCPIALALKEQLNLKKVHVGAWSVEIGTVEVTLPPKAQTFVDRFDDKESVRPFKFTL